MTAAPVHAAPAYDIIGRQPKVLHISPSKSYPWYGKIIEGRRFTVEQELGLAHLGIKPDDVEAMKVRRTSNDNEFWTPLYTYPPVFEFECPILGHRADGKVKVLSPCGDAKLIFSNGWIGKHPKKRMY